MLAPEKASIWLNTVEFIKMRKTIAETLMVASNDVRIDLYDMDRKHTARIITPSTPDAPASVGVAIPRTMKPTTMKIISPMGKMFVQTILNFTRMVMYGTS